jgi:peptide/nickel transport system permease protein
MLKYIARRIGTALIVFFLVTLIIFFTVRLGMGDPVVYMYKLNTSAGQASAQIGSDNTTLTELLERLSDDLDLDDPYPVRYLKWMGRALRGDLGISATYREEASELIGERLPFTLIISLTVFVLSCLLALLVGAALRARLKRRLVTAFTVLANVIIAIPIFYLALLMIYFVLLPLQESALPDFWERAAVYVPGIMAFIILVAAFILKYVYFDFLRPQKKPSNAEAAFQKITYRQALKAGLFPLLKRSGLIFNIVLSGMVLVEVVIHGGGVFRLFVNSIFAQDYNFIQGVLLVIAGIFILFNLIMDIIKKWVEPKLLKYSL